MSLWMKSYDVTIQMKASELFFVWYCLLCCKTVVLTFESVNELTMQMKATKKYFSVIQGTKL